MVLQLKNTFLLFIFLVVLCPHIAEAQASFTANISPGTIGKNETAELRLMINNARQVDQVIPPSLKDFIVLSGPNQESGMVNNNGVTKQYIGITYLLRPKSTGKFTIASAMAKADGKTLKSNRVTLIVTKNASGNTSSGSVPGFGSLSPFTEPTVRSDFNDFIIKKGENLSDKVQKNIFIKVDVNKSSCYVGEPLVVTYKLYTRLKSESSITKNPSFNGFSVIDLLQPGNSYYSVENLKGRQYNMYTLRKAQLYPLQAGTVELETTEVENNIHFIKEEYINNQQGGLGNMFRDFAQTSIPAEALHDEKVTLQSKPLLITVKALPEKNKPLFFKGAVGTFTIEAILEKNSFTTDDAGKLNIAISGEGNMSMVISPDINWPDGIESYEPQTSEQLDKLVVPVSGTKNFEYNFTVAKAGSYEIPAIVFSFFDVKEGKYKTVSTKSFPVIVTKGIGKKPVSTDLNTIKYPANENFFDTLFTNRWLIVIPLAVLMLTGLFIWLQKDKKNHAASLVAKKIEPDSSPEVAKTTPEFQVNPFELTEEKMVKQDTSGFYEALNNEFRKFLACRLQIPLATINKKTVAAEADKQQIPFNTSLQIVQLLDEIEWQLYTPFKAEDKMEDLYNKADAVVHALNATTL